jgi:hypothetical protein
MGDADRQLHEALNEVHELLEDTADLQEEDRAELRSAIREIRVALDAGAESDAGSIRERLKAAVERFEESHPRLTEMVGRIADSLAELGI